ncbi:MAG: hypothetical protein HY696_04410 [Deltaproteobacteria bacterium]|nr:hypothetical protein [Deltaproteobacteria bacterium]
MTERNRLEAQWPYVERKLCGQYPRVPAELWAGTEGAHDRIVRLVRDLYVPGRANIVVEAEVRDLLNQWVTEAEAVADQEGGV